MGRSHPQKQASHHFRDEGAVWPPASRGRHAEMHRLTTDWMQHPGLSALPLMTPTLWLSWDFSCLSSPSFHVKRLSACCPYWISSSVSTAGRRAHNQVTLPINTGPKLMMKMMMIYVTISYILPLYFNWWFFSFLPLLGKKFFTHVSPTTENLDLQLESFLDWFYQKICLLYNF